MFISLHTNMTCNRLTSFKPCSLLIVPYTKTASHLSAPKFLQNCPTTSTDTIWSYSLVVSWLLLCFVQPPCPSSTSNGLWTARVLSIVNHAEVATLGTSLQGIPGGTFHVLKVLHGSISQTGSVWFLSFLTLLYHGASPHRAIPSSSRSPAANFTMNELPIYISYHHR